MLQKLSVDIFKWVENTLPHNKYFMEIYNEDSDIGSFIEVDVHYPEELHEFHNDLPFSVERIKI